MERLGYERPGCYRRRDMICIMPLAGVKEGLITRAGNSLPAEFRDKLIAVSYWYRRVLDAVVQLGSGQSFCEI